MVVIQTNANVDEKPPADKPGLSGRGATFLHSKLEKRMSAEPRMNLYEEISAASKILEFPETATVAAIKSNYRKLLAKWHPDKCTKNKETCVEMTRRVIAAYQTIMDYCLQYQYSFSKESVKRHLQPAVCSHSSLYRNMLLTIRTIPGPSLVFRATP